MWIDSTMVLDCWSSLHALDHYLPHTPVPASSVALSSSLFSSSPCVSESCCSAEAGDLSGIIPLIGAIGRGCGARHLNAVTTLVDVKIEYKHAHGRSGFGLNWYACPWPYPLVCIV